MNIQTALSEDGEKLYVILTDPECPEDKTAVQLNIDEAKNFLGLIYDLIQEAQGIQDLIAMGFKDGN
jgi:hypothetical protein